MSKITGNEMAYPVARTATGTGVDYFETGGNKGLTIRQYFAAMAMQGLIAAGNGHWESTAIEAGGFADALINELNKTQSI